MKLYNLFKSILSRSNLAVLFKAIRDEPLSQIFHNLKKKIRYERGIHQLTQKGESLFVEECVFFNNQILIAGWYKGPKEVKGITVSLDAQEQGQAIKNISRPDLAFRLVKSDHNSIPEGFAFRKKWKNKITPSSRAKLKITFTDDSTHLTEFRIKKIYHYPALQTDIAYQIFLQKEHDATAPDMAKMALLPVLSIIMPVYNTDGELLDEAIQSIVHQSYPHWELSIYDDASSSRETLEVLKKWSRHDQIEVSYGKDNVHISMASNHAIKQTKGQFIGFVDHDDLLHPHALLEVVQVINEHPDADMIYTDEDKVDLNNTRSDPHFKSDFNLDLLRCQNYIAHFTVIRKSLGNETGWLRKGYEGAQDHDLFLRIAERTDRVHHIPKILYHWRKSKTSTASDHANKSYARDAGIRAVQSHFERMHISAIVKAGNYDGTYKPEYQLEQYPEVSIIIPFRDKVNLLKNCLDSIRSNTTYPNYKIFAVDNNSKELSTLKYLKELQRDPKVGVLRFEGAFNYSAINNYAIQQTTNDYILLLNNDIVIPEPGWLHTMMYHIQRKEVGAVGIKLLYEDKKIQHGGVYLGIGGVAGHGFRHFRNSQPTYVYRGHMTQNLSAVTGACLLVKRSVFEKVRGLDEENLKVAFNDIDLCLKIRQQGYLVVYVGEQYLYHLESKSRGRPRTTQEIERFQSEEKFMKDTWGELLRNDPYYNPNLTLEREDFSIRIE